MTVAESNIAVEHPLAVLVDAHVRYASAQTPRGGYRLELPPDFDVDFEHRGRHWVVRDRETGIFGRGDDPLSAVRDFARATADHLDVLERQEALSQGLTAQLQYLRERVRR
jgi:hypothetical protein